MSPADYVYNMSKAIYNEQYARTERGKALAYSDLSQALDALSRQDRINLREALIAYGYDKLMRNLSYDYDKQEWF